MDSGNQNWLMKRKPRFAGKENWDLKLEPLLGGKNFRSDASPLQARNSVCVDSQPERFSYSLRSKISSVKDSDEGQTLSSRKVKEYYSSVHSGRNQRHHDDFYSSGQGHSEKEKSPNTFYKQDHMYNKEQREQKKIPGSSVKLRITSEKPAMLKKSLDHEALKSIVAQARANRLSRTSHKELESSCQSIRSYSRLNLKDSSHTGKPVDLGSLSTMGLATEAKLNQLSWISRREFDSSCQSIRSFSRTNEKDSSHVDGELPRLTVNQKSVPSSISKEFLLEEDPSDLDCDPESLKECRRALCFDNIQESQENEDMTTPLDMIDMTAMLTDASVLQGSLPEQEVNHMQESTSSSTKVVSENNLIKKDEPKPFSSKLPEPKIIVSQLEATTCKALAGKANITKRRTVIPVSKSNTEYKLKPKLSHSASKVKLLGTQASQLKSVKRGLKTGLKLSSKKKQRKSLLPDVKKARRSVIPDVKKPRRSLLPDLPKVTVVPPEPDPDPDPDPKPELVVKEEEQKKVEVCDASTNTGMMFLLGRSPNKDLINEIDSLMEEQEEITKKAQLILDETLERRKKMRSTNLLESFMTSVSPLKRLCGMVQEKTSYLDSSATKADALDSSAFDNKSACFENSNMDISGMDTTGYNESFNCSILNNTGELNSRNSKWKHLKLNSRNLQTTSSCPKTTEKISEEVILDPVISDDEEFMEVEKDISPFTAMAGCCERPSLAPMTPHSHKQVSMIKWSLRNQLNQLYDA